MGGTHLIEADEARINTTIDYFEKIGLSHCTGDKAIKLFKSRTDKAFINGVGHILNIE